MAAFTLPDTQNAAWSGDRSRFGFSMLSKMGWTEGKGLGRREDGLTAHVKVTKRSDTLGLGASVAAGGGDVGLTAAVSDYNALLASLAGSSKVAGRKRARSASGDSSSSAAAVAAAAGAAAAPAAPPTRIIGRFAHHKVLRQKNVAGYSAEDLRAVLGTTAGLVTGGAVGGAGDAAAPPPAPVVSVVSRTAERADDRKRARALKKLERAARRKAREERRAKRELDRAK
jgi:Pin2-interacting protein X1